MDFPDDISDYDPPSPVQPPRVFDIEENKPYSLMYNEKTKTMKKREADFYLRPICIDGIDVSKRWNKRRESHRETYSQDQLIINVRAISITLWYFISRGHTAIVFLPSVLREMVKRCTDPHELHSLYKLELIVFNDKNCDTPSALVTLSKEIASFAEKCDGCIVGSRRKYCSLTRKYPNLDDTVTNGFIQPNYTHEMNMTISDDVRLVLSINEIRRSYEDTEDAFSFQLLASDQVLVMTKLARIFKDDAMIDLCAKTRELNQHGMPMYKPKRSFHKSSNQPSSYLEPYQYGDEYLPEYVAPPSLKSQDLVKISRIGHKDSIYRVGEMNEECNNNIISNNNRYGNMITDINKLSMRRPLIDALQQIFGCEKKANRIVNENPNIEEINELIEIGLALDSTPSNSHT